MKLLSLITTFLDSTTQSTSDFARLSGFVVFKTEWTDWRKRWLNFQYLGCDGKQVVEGAEVLDLYYLSYSHHSYCSQKSMHVLRLQENSNFRDWNLKCFSPSRFFDGSYYTISMGKEYTLVDVSAYLWPSSGSCVLQRQQRCALCPY